MLTLDLLVHFIQLTYLSKKKKNFIQLTHFNTLENQSPLSNLS